MKEMSTSVLLEGSVNDLNSDEVKWNGVWKFAKDKKGILSFQYSKVSLEVERDLYEYVSFMDAATLEFQKTAPQKGGPGSSKSKKRGRGRPSFSPNSSGPVSTQNGVVASQSGDANTTSKADETNFGQHSSEQDDSQIPVNIDHDLSREHDNEAMDVAENNEGDQDQKADDGGEMDVDAGQDETETKEQEDNAPQQLIIKATHPLMGVWQGSFAVKTLKGEEYINETLFFYTTLGAEANEEFKDLPPEPVFPYCLLRKQDPSASSAKVVGFASPTAVSSNIMPSKEELSSSTEGIDIKVESSDVTADSTQPLTAEVVATSNVEVKTEANSTIDGTNNNEGATTATTDSDPTHKSSQYNFANIDHDPDAFNSIAISQAYGYTPAAVDNIYKKILIGFGKNAIGRFSVAAMYDEATGELRCEKKYMSVKYSIKRGRRSHAEYVLNHGPGSAPPPIIERPPSVRKSSSSFSVASLLDNSEYHSSSKHRTSKANAAAVVAAATNSSYSLHDDENTTSEAKRAKKNASSSSSKYKSSDGPKEKKSSKSKDEPQVLIFNNPNALVGSRNPDNDDPHSVYREAFQDVDTGEVYEGSWSFGFRHGHGICLYSDGLMYEGNWIKGKEHGKGELMTGDRRVIYSGDWVDGQFHGHGTYNFGNGDQYVGDWKEGNRHGKGDYIFAIGCIYSGDWRDNKRHGKGRFTWPDGSIYEGEWEQDQRHGRGILDLMNGFHYDGTWSRNVMEGKGLNIFPSGQMYQGTFKNGLRDGRGSVTFAEGAVYEGRFREDRFEGHGTIKINHVVPGVTPAELLIPVSIQSELWRIHWKAGFGNNSH